MQLRTCNLQLGTGNWQLAGHLSALCSGGTGLVNPDSSPDFSPDSTSSHLPFAMAHSLQTLALESESWPLGVWS
ncbi:unnamed protein product [Ambrosiozyma monospora]|uniref:Unnamed protein product n=1 Tax=Ambrosiozyma monospora TaxID=43982 RepID=A0A9W6YTL3_AMBMO|nr:unnamed protein product [Ambrosiozyma monospora]